MNWTALDTFAVTVHQVPSFRICRALMPSTVRPEGGFLETITNFILGVEDIPKLDAALGDLVNCVINTTIEVSRTYL